MQTALLKIIMSIAVVAAIVAIIQIWAPFLDSVIFWKILMTLGIVGLVAGFLIVVQLDFSENKRLKDDNYID